MFPTCITHIGIEVEAAKCFVANHGVQIFAPTDHASLDNRVRVLIKVADYADVMERGEIALDGPAAQLATNPKVIESYLGLGGGH